MDAVKLNELLKNQEELGGRFKTLLTNMKKDSASRKTHKYIADKRTLLSEMKMQVEENHDQLKTEERLSTHIYMTSYYSSLQNVYEEATAYLDKCEEELMKISQGGSKDIRFAGSQEVSPKLGMQKGRISQLAKKLAAARQAVTENKPIWFLQTTLQAIQKQWEIVEEAHLGLCVEETLFDDEYFTKEGFEASQKDVEDTSYQLQAKINEVAEPAIQRSSTETKKGVNLPKITIPVFMGDYESWYSFHDLFKNLIHNDTTLSSTEKMQYLKTHVKGEPAKIIQQLSISEANYDTAWVLLTQRYENKRLITSKFIDKLLDLPTIEQPSAVKIKSMFDTIKESLAALNNQGVDTSQWDPIITRIVCRKWDSDTNNIYELALKEPNMNQSLAEMMEFMEKRFKCLETANHAPLTQPQKGYGKGMSSASETSKLNVRRCWYCNNENHSIYYCTKFKMLSVTDRLKVVRERKICYNCINHDTTEKCKSTVLCHFCNKPHHSMIHVNPPSNPINKSNDVRNQSGFRYPTYNREGQNRDRRIQKTTTHAAITAEPREPPKRTTLLATALVETTTYYGEPKLLRVLCDQGSEASFCTEEVAQMLSYPRQKIRTQVKGVGDEQPKESKHCITITIKPRFPSQYKLPVTLIVLPKLTSAVPKQDLSQLNTKDIENKIIADPTYYKKGPIDVILGAQEYSQFLRDGFERMEDNMIAQETEFGWILSGWRLTDFVDSMKVMCMTSCSEEVKQLTAFWELEEVQRNVELSEDDRICEEYYKKSTVRGKDGTYTVRIPLKNPDLEYGETRQKAVARLFQIEKSFNKNDMLRKQYNEFMAEYLRMGHMMKVDKAAYNKGKYYIPHHAVIRDDSLTTKLRVVFDASSKEKGYPSLNENMYKGPRLQEDLSDILLRWRKHRVAFMADLEKMYRFIKVHRSDLRYQRILWRWSTSEPIKEYELTTVTYGTASAPYLAVRTLQQLARDEQGSYPLASRTTLQDFYVDDILSGADSDEEATMLQGQLISMLQKGGFNLRKWSSNKMELLNNIPEASKENDMIKLPQHETRKSLGVIWSPAEDNFHFQIKIANTEKLTKRFILSEISKIFDPMGWLAPILVEMKLLIQELWTNGVEWDTPVDEAIKKRWEDFYTQIKTIETVRIPRWINYSNAMIELHGFCDASEKAYGAVIYSRVKVNGQYYISLLQAKSKVAPKKNKSTLPRLELCAAHLLSKLIFKVKESLNCDKVSVHCWTDSMITIGWIKGEAGKWQTFVANRVSDIQKSTPSKCWNHVKTTDNPADVLSRGIEPQKLENHKLWWKGPSWLQEDELPCTKTTLEICQEIESSHVTTAEDKDQKKIWERFSGFQHMIRVLSYCYRMNQKDRSSETLTCTEMKQTTDKILKLVQKEAFAEEYELLENKKQIKKRSKLRCLDPFIDEEGLVRVGGRLHHSQLPYNQRHPVLLPHNHHVSKILIDQAHLQTLHGGTKLTMAFVRQKYWILGLKKMTKSCIRNCVKCIRYKAATASQKMGQLPAPRVTPSHTFNHTGVDMAGPIQVRTTKGRGNKATKGYIAVFICLATKAIHLELVGDLSTESFIAAFIRFKARRGHVSHMYSDNGRNFLGAARMLHTQLLEITQTPQVQNAIANMGTQWHFNPPLAPHFGGIWEAGVKSMKYHLKRVIGESTLTYEELSTLLNQVETCLNSRPLCAQSDDINDNTVLTPSHFLIGREAVGIPDPINDVSVNLQDRWKLIQKIKKDFWKTWSRDYLHQLQQRYKWQFNQENIKKGTVVLIKDENITPSKWPLARIIETHPGSDGITRVVTLLKAPGNCLKRAVHKIIPLPNTEDDTTGTQHAEITSNVTQLAAVNVMTGELRSDIRESRNQTIETRGENTTPTLGPREKNRQRRTKSSGNKYSWMLFVTLISCLMNVTMANYTIKHINEGIYVEHIGTATIDRGIFRIQTNYEKSKIEEDVKNIRGITAQFKDYCDTLSKTNTEIHCTQLYHHLHEGQEKLERISSLVMNIGQIRKKRGLFGQMLTSIFGVNDEVYKDIDTLQGNQNKLIEAANHQTKFMISTIATVNQTEERIAKKLERFQIKLNQAIQYLNNVNTWYKRIDLNRVNIHILHMYQLATNYIDEVIEYYSRLQEAYMHQGTIYDVLELKEVKEILTEANTKLPTKLRIVQNHLIDTKVTEDSTHIKVYGYFALQDITKYTLIHVTPVPKKDKEGKVYSLEVYHNIIAIDYNNENFFELEQEEFKACRRRYTEYICYPTSVKNMQTNKNCIIDLLFKKTEMVNCNTRQLNITTTVWKQLYMPNTWLVVTTKSVKTSIICDGEREETIIQNTAVIHIAENCIIKTKSNILAARRANTISVLSTYSRQANFSLNTNETVKQIEDIARDEEVLDSSRDIFKHLINNEKLLKKELDNTIWKQIQSNTVAISLGSSLAVFILMILTVCYGPQVMSWIRSCAASVRTAPSHAAPARSAPPKPERRRPNSTTTSGHFDEIELHPIQPL